TFTDVVGRRPDGSLATAKLLSHDPGRYRDAAVAGIRRMLGLAPGEEVPAERISRLTSRQASDAIASLNVADGRMTAAALAGSGWK
ncbi:hypothetical protein ACFVAO_33555, partial [Streptomyces californicus]|uniref:hypothetical protein n=1 Tax=Streptomyces californicus TaxID=67351 RepID=UPI003699F216